MTVPFLDKSSKRGSKTGYHSSSTNMVIGDYTVSEKCIGKGSTGKVMLGTHTKTGQKVAIKIVRRAVFFATPSPKTLRREQSKITRAIREAQLLRLLRHPHIIRYCDFVCTDQELYLITNFISGGQLLQYILKRKRLSERRACHFARQIGSALDYLHRHSIVHRDLKIENILIDQTATNVTIIDLGLSNLFCPERRLTTYCGSLYFAAPELLNATPYHGPEVDVWSFGVVLYVMVTGTVPFDDRSMPGLYRKIRAAQVQYPSHVSEGCRRLLESIFVADKTERILLADVLTDQWLLGRYTAIDNGVPLRQPLALPIDEKILGHMTHGLGLGTVDEIRNNLTLILQSNVYRIAAEHVSRQQARDMLSRTWPRSSNTDNDSPDSSFLFWGAYHDPQTVPAAYHPLVSIYYLVKEYLIASQNSTPSSGPSPNKLTYHVITNAAPNSSCPLVGVGRRLSSRLPSIALTIASAPRPSTVSTCASSDMPDPTHLTSKPSWLSTLSRLFIWASPNTYKRRHNHLSISTAPDLAPKCSSEATTAMNWACTPARPVKQRIRGWFRRSSCADSVPRTKPCLTIQV